jgi:SagB-type dehydrogenase family enzyme
MSVETLHLVQGDTNPCMMPGMEPLDQVIRYHQATKHHLFRYARALGYLDWANQPNPFRRYIGAPLIRLPLLKPDEDPLSPPYEDLYRPDSAPIVSISLRSISRFLEYALSITAWKQAGESKWALRSNPSSGNLHPTEGYLVIGPVPELATTSGLYHYAPKEHALEQRVSYSTELLAALMKNFPPHAFLVGLSSIHWREAWKYGERAYRYCQHDAGHAIGTLRIAAAALGWRMMLLEGLSDETIEWVLGLNRAMDFEGAEREHPDMLAAVWPPPSAQIPLFLDPGAVYELVNDSLERWQGKANRLSPEDPVAWEIIDDVASAARKLTIHRKSVQAPGRPRTTPTHPSPLEGEGERPELSASQVIHQRRSALAFDGKTSLSSENFFHMMLRVMPRVELDIAARPMPWDAIPWNPMIHLGLFVHRVNDIPPGLYMLLRDPSKKEIFQQAMHPQFEWRRPPACPEDLPLYLLEEGNAQQLAAQVSCHQEIAGASAFSLGMIAEFEAALRSHGSWFYRRLFWETGLIGQVLYLEAEAAAVRATGIGCFFDDPVHEVLGFKGLHFQSLYHFTTGGPVDDPRLTTLPAYGDHAEGEARGIDLP